jgi:hypothetical protein
LLCIFFLFVIGYFCNVITSSWLLYRIQYCT